MAGTATSLSAPADATSPSSLNITLTLFKKNGFQDTAGKVVELSLDGPGQLSATSVTLGSAAGDTKRLTGTASLSRATANQVGRATVRASLGALNASFAVEFPPAPPPPPTSPK
jgi:hypothetical protein